MIHVSGTLDTPNATENRPSSSNTTGQSPPLSAKNSLDHGLWARRRRRSCRARRRRCRARLLLDERDQLGVLAPARHAVRREEVEHHPTALATREVERRAVGEHARSRRVPDGRAAACRPSRCGAGRHRRARRTARPARRDGAGRRTARRAGAPPRLVDSVTASTSVMTTVVDRSSTGSRRGRDTGADTGSVGRRRRCPGTRRASCRPPSARRRSTATGPSA